MSKRKKTLNGALIGINEENNNTISKPMSNEALNDNELYQLNDLIKIIQSDTKVFKLNDGTSMNYKAFKSMSVLY